MNVLKISLLNLSATATLGTDENDRYREVAVMGRYWRNMTHVKHRPPTRCTYLQNNTRYSPVGQSSISWLLCRGKVASLGRALVDLSSRRRCGEVAVVQRLL